MRLLLTSGGIANASIHDALVDLLGKPVAESSALFVPTGIYPFPGGAGMAWQAICGKTKSPLGRLGWKSLGLVDFALRVHLDREGFEDSTLSEIERWAAGIPAPTYAIDDETALTVTDGTVGVVSEGNWKLLTPSPEAW